MFIRFVFVGRRFEQASTSFEQKLQENNNEMSTITNGELKVYNFAVVAGVTREDLRVEHPELGKF